MSQGTALREDVRQIVNDYGKIISFTHLYSQESVGDYDDVVDWFTSGTTIYTSGCVFPLSTEKGSYESTLLEQGKLKSNDQTLYTTGDVDTTVDEDHLIKIGIGSPASYYCNLIPNFVIAQELNGDLVYKKCFIRRLTGSKYIGEG